VTTHGRFYDSCKEKAVAGNTRKISGKGGDRGGKTTFEMRFNAESAMRGLVVEKKDRVWLRPDGANHETIEMRSIKYSGVGFFPLLFGRPRVSGYSRRKPLLHLPYQSP
jgi:hypothetical protein